MHLTDEQLSAYVDGEFTAAEFAAARKHVDGCAACAAEVAAFEALTGKLAGAVEPSADFEARTLAKLRALPLPKAPWYRFVFAPSFRFAAAGAAVVAVAAVGAYQAGYMDAKGPEVAGTAPEATLVTSEDATVAEQADFLEDLEMIEELDVLEGMDGVPG